MDAKPSRWLPLMSAPGALGVGPDSVPQNAPYLAAEPARVAQWAAWLRSDGFTIGINWSAGAGRGAFADRRNIPLAAFAPLAAIDGVRLISLQKGAAAQQIAATALHDKIEVPETDPNPDIDNFVDTAALMASLDLVVSCDTAVPHLAGALGRPVFTALPYVPDWRWLRERDDSPWYPTMRLFRQRTPQNWSELFERIAAAAADLASAQQR
jgi:ADP-heptose:LPS heptosyltransferase